MFEDNFCFSSELTYLPLGTLNICIEVHFDADSTGPLYKGEGEPEEAIRVEHLGVQTRAGVAIPQQGLIPVVFTAGFDLDH